MPRNVLFASVIGFVLRMALSAQPVYNFDVESYGIVAGIVRHNGNVYAETYRYNYSPVWSILLGLLSFLPVWFPLAVRGFLSIVDTFNGFLLRKLFGDRAGILYWLSPVAFLIAGFHGQFDTLSATPLLLAMVYYPAARARNTWVPWLLAALAILIKHLIVFGAWTFLVYRYGFRKAIWLAALAVGVLALSFVPYLPDGGPGILENVILYHSIPVLVGLGSFPPIISYPIFLAVMFVVPFVAQKLQFNEAEAMALSAVCLITFIPGTSPQYWIIVAIFGLGFLDRLGRWYLVFTLATTISLIVVYAVFGSMLPYPFISSMNLAWLACLAALVLIYRSYRAQSSAAVSGAIPGPKNSPG